MRNHSSVALRKPGSFFSTSSMSTVKKKFFFQHFDPFWFLCTVQLGGKGVLDINGKHLPVGLTLVEEGHDTEDLLSCFRTRPPQNNVYRNSHTP